MSISIEQLLPAVSVKTDLGVSNTETETSVGQCDEPGDAATQLKRTGALASAISALQSVWHVMPVTWTWIMLFVSIHFSTGRKSVKLDLT